MVGAQLLAVFECYTAHVACTRAVGLHQQIIDALAESDFAAERFNRRAHLFHHPHEAERADVRFADVGDFVGGASPDEFVDHLAPVVLRVADLAPQLAVGKRARPAFAELHVGLGVEHLFAPQAPRVFRAFAYGLAALEDDRAEAHLGEHETGEQAARTHADHDRAQREVLRCARHKRVARVRRAHDLAAVAGARELRGLVVQLQPPKDVGFARRVHVDRVDQHDRAAAARVVAALGDGEPGQFVGCDAQPRQDRLAQRRLGVLQR